jgi:hypothetical protein
MLNKYEEHVNIIFIRDQKTKQKILEGQKHNVFILSTKIKTRYIFNDKKFIYLTKKHRNQQTTQTLHNNKQVIYFIFKCLKL